MTRLEVGSLLDANPEDDRRVQQERPDGIKPDEMSRTSCFLREEIPGGVRCRGEQDRDQCNERNCLGLNPGTQGLINP